MDIAKAEQPPADYDLLVDFRDSHSRLSLVNVYQLAAELWRHADSFRGKVALLVLPGIGFDRASFFETCSVNRGFSVNAFTDYEAAMRWMLAAEDSPAALAPAPPATGGDGKLAASSVKAGSAGKWAGATD